MDSIYTSNVITTITKLSPLTITKIHNLFLNRILSFLFILESIFPCVPTPQILSQYIFMLGSLYPAFISYLSYLYTTNYFK